MATAAGVVLGLTPIVFPVILAGVHRRRGRDPLGVAGLDRGRLSGAGRGLAAGQRAGRGLYLLVAALVVYKHRENIGRLLKGQENRLSFGAKPAS